MSPSTLPYGRRIVTAAESGTFARAPITSRVLPPPIVVGPTRQDEIEERIAAARAEGYEAGCHDAINEPRLEIEQQHVAAVASFLASLAAATERLAADRTRLIDEMTGEVAELAFAVVEAALGANLAGGEGLRTALGRALELVPENEPITIRVHPDAVVNPEELRTIVGNVAVAIVPDPGVDLHGCVVEAGACRIDAQIPTAIERVARVFDTVRPHVGAGGAASA